MENIMEQYITQTEKNIHKYMKMIFNSYYDKDIVSEYVTTYINVRYYNIYNGKNKSRPFYLKIMDEINQKCDKLLERYFTKKIEEDRSKIIKDIKQVFNYILFFDNVRKIENFKNIDSIREIINELVRIREEEFGIKNREEFKENLYKTILDDMIKKEIYIDEFENEDFNLEFEKLGEEDLYDVTLNYNMKMPKEFSDLAIDEVFNKGIIGEDKLEIEYLLLSVVVLKDILEGNFKDTYIAEFKTSLFEKQSKIERILEKIDNQALQEKINLKITYENFIENKEKVYEYIKDGFKFAIELDNSIKDINEIDELKMFKYILIPENLKQKRELLRENKDNERLIIL